MLRVRVESIRRREDLPWKRRYHLGAGVSDWLKRGERRKHKAPAFLSPFPNCWSSQTSYFMPLLLSPTQQDRLYAPNAPNFFLFICLVFSILPQWCRNSQRWLQDIKYYSNAPQLTQSLEIDEEKVAGWSGCRWASVVLFCDTGSHCLAGLELTR